MSLSLQFRGSTTKVWDLSTSMIDELHQMQDDASVAAIETIFGGTNASPGVERIVKTKDVRDAAVALRRAYEPKPHYQVRCSPMPGKVPEVVGPGVAGVFIGGQPYYIRCHGDHWTIEAASGPQIGRLPLVRRESAEIASDNMGTVKVEIAPRRNEAGKFLAAVHRFIGHEKRPTIGITWG